MKNCKCKPSTEYFDAEGRAFNVFNEQCDIHTYLNKPTSKSSKLKFTNSMIKCVLDTRGMGSQDATDVFNLKFRTNKHISFINNARFRYKNLEL
jgi:hypothetical protein